MRLVFKRLLILINFIILGFLFANQAFATYHEESLIHGFNVKSESYAATKFKYNYSIFPWNWQRNSYAFYESDQVVSYTLKKSSIYYYIRAYARFNSVNMEPGWGQENLRKYSSKEIGVKINIC